MQVTPPPTHPPPALQQLYVLGAHVWVLQPSSVDPQGRVGLQDGTQPGGGTPGGGFTTGGGGAGGGGGGGTQPARPVMGQSLLQSSLNVDPHGCSHGSQIGMQGVTSQVLAGFP